jgi:hypothetical protein
MATFQQWLTAQVAREDWPGTIARIWRDAEGNRPKLHSPSGIHRWLQDSSGQWSDQVEHGWDVTLAEYRQLKDGPALSVVGDAAEPGPVVRTIAIALAQMQLQLDAICQHFGIAYEQPAPEHEPAFTDPLATPEQAEAAIADYAAQQAAGRAAQGILGMVPAEVQPDTGQHGWEHLVALTDWTEATGDAG